MNKSIEKKNNIRFIIMEEISPFLNLNTIPPLLIKVKNAKYELFSR
jgi:hypothetical protein